MAKTSALMTCLTMSVLLLLVVVICGAASVRAAPAVEQSVDNQPGNVEESLLRDQTRPVPHTVAMQAKYGKVDVYRRFLPNMLEKVAARPIDFFTPSRGADCVVAFSETREDPDYPWFCEETDDKCSKGLALVEKKDALDSIYRLEKFKSERAREKKKALMAFCPAKNIEMTKHPWRPTYFWAKTDPHHRKNKTFFLKLEHNQEAFFAPQEDVYEATAAPPASDSARRGSQPGPADDLWTGY